jgi:predicted nucleic acid-binding protein
MATMADRVVVDASAAMAMIRREPQDSFIRRVLSNEDVEVWVPWIFWYELANSLIRRHRLGLDPVLEVIGTLDGMGIRTVDGDRPAVIAAAALAAAHGLSVYDALYLALAERMDARLLTLDVDLAAAAGDRAFAIGHELRETRVSYELRPWVRWSELDAYLDAVREATIASAR